jgi:DNA helicase-2/ATP-dependent DNA helicase PcrA
VDGPALAALKAWRRERSRADAVPAYIVFSDRALEALAAALPRDDTALLAVPGVGPTKLERYGKDVLGVLAPFAGG